MKAVKSIIKITCPKCSWIFEYLIPERVPRTLRQQRYYRGYVVGIPADHFGYSNEEMHNVYRLMFLRMDEEGKPETIKSTTDLNTQEFVEYVKKCRRWAAKEGINIPDPEEVFKDDKNQPETSIT